MARTLWIGPWCGELGHEIMSWQANARRRARKWNGRIVVGCTEASTALYRDFADEFWLVPYEHNTTGATRYSKTDERWAQAFRKLHRPGDQWMRPRVLRPDQGDFIAYGTWRWGCTFDVVVHARDMVKGSKGGDRRRCWPHEKWMALAARLNDARYRVCCIGLPGHALYLPGADDQRGIVLSAVMDLLASSRVIVGPSSGPIHLAALCKCPAVVWSDLQHRAHHAKTNRDRLTNWWNPFRTPVTLIDGWNPSVREVFRPLAKKVQDAINHDVDGAHAKPPAVGPRPVQ